MKSTSVLGLVLVAACGPGLAARDTREVGRDSLASAAGDPRALRELFHDSVVGGGVLNASNTEALSGVPPSNGPGPREKHGASVDAAARE